MGRTPYRQSRKRQMDKLKRGLNVSAIILIIVSAFVLCGGICGGQTAYAASRTCYALYPDTPLYDAPDGEVIASIPQNAEVSLGALSGGWYEATYLDVSGYLKQSEVYFSYGETSLLEVRSMKVLADGVGMSVELKAAPYDSAMTLASFGDGTRIEVVECGSEDYYRVVGKDTEMYIPKANVTDSLTRNQRVAVIIISIGVAAMIAGLALVYVIRNKPGYKNK